MAVLDASSPTSIRAMIEDVKKKSQMIIEFELETGADRDGDAAAWVTLVIPDDASPVEADGRLKEDATRPGGLLSVVGEIEQAIKQQGIVPSVHFRTRSEQDQVNADRAKRPS